MRKPRVFGSAFVSSALLSSVLLASIAMLAQNPPAAKPFFFIQLADPQLGISNNDLDFTQETANYEFAVATINRLRPNFVVICGDLINKTGDPAQVAEYFRITAKIDKSIPVYALPGNHDVGNEPTPESLKAYRDRFGPDYYSFRQGEIYGIVLDASVIAAPTKVQSDADAQEAFLKAELQKAKASGAAHIVVFQHQSWFLEDPKEPSQYFNIPLEQRRRYLDLLEGAGVRYVFGGHYHRNAFGKDGPLEMITSGPVSRPLGTDPTGIRIVSVQGNVLEHTYFDMGSIPNQYPPAPTARGRGAAR